MAEGFLKRFAPSVEVYSAGTVPAAEVHPKTVAVMREKGIDLATYAPKRVEQFLSQSFDYVVTVCDGANESCPAFVGMVSHRLHIGFEDPAKVQGSDDFVLQEFRRIRDEIEQQFKSLAERVSR
jgi:arsenate reductase